MERASGFPQVKDNHISGKPIPPTLSLTLKLGFELFFRFLHYRIISSPSSPHEEGYLRSLRLTQDSRIPWNWRDDFPVFSASTRNNKKAFVWKSRSQFLLYFLLPTSKSTQEPLFSSTIQISTLQIPGFLLPIRKTSGLVNLRSMTILRFECPEFWHGSIRI